MSHQPPDPYHPASPPPAAPAGQYSPDGRWYWDGRQWLPVTAPGPPWARPYAPPEDRAAAAVAMVALGMAASAILMVDSAFVLVAPLAGPPRGAVAFAAAGVAVLGGIARAAGAIGAAIAVPMWTHRAFRNLPALGEQDLGGWSPAWAAGGWFIPFANLVIPYLVMRVLWSSSGEGRPLPEGWWALWIGGGVLLLGSGFAALANRALGNAMAILGDAALLASGFLLVAVILRVSRSQRARYERLRAR